MKSNVEVVRDAAIGHHSAIAPVFEEFYKDLDADRFRNAFTYGREKVDRMLDEELKKLRPAARILDVGCGTGNYLVRLRDLGFEAKGVEPAAGMREAAARLDPTLDISDGIATSLPFPDASFDMVIAIEVLRYLHLADTRLALREFMRVLRPGGRVFITMVNRFALDGFYLHQSLRQRLKGRAFDETNPHCEFFTPGEVEEELRRAGASDVVTRGCLWGPLRIPYKLHNRLGRAVAQTMDRYDDAVCSLAIAKPFTGHLVGIGVRA